MVIPLVMLRFINLLLLVYKHYRILVYCGRYLLVLATVVICRAPYMLTLRLGSY